MMLSHISRIGKGKFYRAATWSNRVYVEESVPLSASVPTVTAMMQKLFSLHRPAGTHLLLGESQGWPGGCAAEGRTHVTWYDSVRERRLAEKREGDLRGAPGG